MTVKYSARSARGEVEWAQLFQLTKHPQMVQAWAYGEAKRATGWIPKRLVIEHNGVPAALCQVLEKRIFGVRVASRINRGPMIIDSTADLVGIYSTLRRNWRLLLRGPLLIAPPLDNNDVGMSVLKKSGFRLRRRGAWQSMRVDLSSTEDELRKSLKPKWRNQLNVAERHGLTFQSGNGPQDVAWIIDRHAENMRTKEFSGPSPTLLMALYKAAPENFLVYKALHNDIPVAGMIVFKFEPVAEYYIGWYGELGRKLNAGNFLLWNATLALRQLGCKHFDLGGGTTNSGYGKFKLGLPSQVYSQIGEFLSI